MVPNDFLRIGHIQGRDENVIEHLRLTNAFARYRFFPIGLVGHIWDTSYLAFVRSSLPFALRSSSSSSLTSVLFQNSLRWNILWRLTGAEIWRISGFSSARRWDWTVSTVRLRNSYRWDSDSQSNRCSEWVAEPYHCRTQQNPTPVLPLRYSIKFHHSYSEYPTQYRPSWVIEVGGQFYESSFQGLPNMNVPYLPKFSDLL